jgi:hypothetical protein
MWRRDVRGDAVQIRNRRLTMKKSCWFKAVVGVIPHDEYCANGCDNCSFFLPKPQWPKDKNEMDELPEVTPEWNVLLIR